MHLEDLCTASVHQWPECTDVVPLLEPLQEVYDLSINQRSVAGAMRAMGEVERALRRAEGGGLASGPAVRDLPTVGGGRAPPQPAQGGAGGQGAMDVGGAFVARICSPGPLVPLEEDVEMAAGAHVRAEPGQAEEQDDDESELGSEWGIEMVFSDVEDDDALEDGVEEEG